jgi:DNA-binding Lrp family transcriptional regulator
MLTLNEKKVLRLLLTSFDLDHSINQVAKQCKLAPNGALKILKKFKQEGILKTKKIANIISYKINFDNEKTMNVLELVLIPDLKGRIEYRLDDFLELKEITKACIIFGSYIDIKKEPNDLDVLFILNKDNFKEYKKRLTALKNIIPVKVHDVIQTEEDLKRNIKEKNNVIIEILGKGMILWGYKTILKVIKNVN